MNKFLFLTHSTPLSKRTSLRHSLNRIYIQALISQSYANWNVAVLGDSIASDDDRFHFFDLPDVSTAEKHKHVLDLFKSDSFKKLLDSADYIVKLDDDDIISPSLLDTLKEFNGDLYYDSYHTFFDITKGSLTQQKRPWIASTCVHKKEHALAEWKSEGASSVGNLLYSDHSKSWHLYYSKYNIQDAARKHPVYMRILSPSSITAAHTAASSNDTAVAFNEYLKKFGNWDAVPVNDFDCYMELLHQVWKNFSGKSWEVGRKSRFSFFNWIKNHG